jgi:ATP-dependent DNA helicase RecG
LPDRIRIENYWQKPAHFVLGKTVFRRNHIIADLFAKIHFGEKMGTGFERIREVCKKENAPFPEVEFDENYFYVTFRQSHEYLKIAEKGGREATQITTQKTTQKILEAIKENPRITKKELASMIGITENGIKFHINALKKKRLLKRVGPDKGGYWEVLGK